MLFLLYRNEDLQEQLWEMSMRDVEKYLSPESRHTYGTTQQVPLRANSPMTHKHSFRFRHKLEDCQQLIDKMDLTIRESEVAEEEEEGKEERTNQWTRKHSFRTSSVRQKPEDCQQLIDKKDLTIRNHVEA